jgi:hypothetical protein
MWMLVISLTVSVIESNPQIPFEGQTKVLSNQTIIQQIESSSKCENLASAIERNFILANGYATSQEAERYTLSNLSKPTRIFTGVSHECLNLK